MNTIKASTPATDRKSLARKPTRKDGGMAVAKTCFAYQRVVNAKLFKFGANARCLNCDAPLVVIYGTYAAALKIGNELVGVLCDDCVSEGSRERLTELREGIAAPRRNAVVKIHAVKADSDDGVPR